MKYLILLMPLLLILNSCDLSSPEEVDDAEIKDILQDIETKFTYLDVDGIMQHYHPEFLNGTDSFSAQRIIWEIRLNEYTSMQIENIDIDLNDQFATAHFELIFDDITTQEPSVQNGDMSYFYREYDVWKLCGENFTEP